MFGFKHIESFDILTLSWGTDLESSVQLGDMSGLRWAQSLLFIHGEGKERWNFGHTSVQG